MLSVAMYSLSYDTVSLQGVNSDLESYAGFITVDKPNDGNMFFWFFPAQGEIYYFPSGSSPLREKFITFLLVLTYSRKKFIFFLLVPTHSGRNLLFSFWFLPAQGEIYYFLSGSYPLREKFIIFLMVHTRSGRNLLVSFWVFPAGRGGGWRKYYFFLVLFNFGEHLLYKHQIVLHITGLA